MIAADVVLALLYTLSLDKVHFTSEHVLQLILHIQMAKQLSSRSRRRGKGNRQQMMSDE
ncbi:MAG: hypothetical protein HY801_03570 [Candidatus Lindowbacteria bacterium]|nr:hypothetical protein [Candidatus Lindowbacteria bacterium]